jgi:hypothetical protein
VADLFEGQLPGRVLNSLAEFRGAAAHAAFVRGYL